MLAAQSADTAGQCPSNNGDYVIFAESEPNVRQLAAEIFKRCSERFASIVRVAGSGLGDDPVGPGASGTCVKRRNEIKYECPIALSTSE